MERSTIRKRITRVATAGTIGGLLITGIANASGETNAGMQIKSRTPVCSNNPEKNTQPLFDLISPNAAYCIQEVIPMGRTEIIDGGHYGELGLVAVKLTFANKRLVCAVPVAHQESKSSLKVEAFSLRDSCVADPNGRG